MPASVAINGSSLTATPSGLGIYAYEVARRILDELPGSFVWCHGACLRQLPCYPGPMPGGAGRLRRLSGAFVGVPRAARRQGARVIFSPNQIDLCRGVSIPRVVTVHDLTPLKFPAYHPRQKYWYRHVLARVLANVERIIAPSEATRRDLMEDMAIRTPVEVIPNGVDHDRFHPRPEAELEAFRRRHGLGAYLLYVGNLFPHKNVAGLIRAHGQSGVDVPLLLAGQGRERFGDMLRPALAAHPRGDLVRFLDYVPAADMPLLYAGARLFLFPSLYEGFGLPPLEAMASGAPVVCARAGAVPEVVGGAGVLFDPPDVAELANLIRRLCADDDERRRLRNLGLARARGFTWERCGEATVEVLREFL